MLGMLFTSVLPVTLFFNHVYFLFSVALAHGSQVTISAASFVLLAKNSIPSSLITLLNVSHKVYARQKMNFGWALVYNVALIPVAAGAFYALNHARLPPVWSALAMALSSVSVVLSSLALQIGL
jgi:P-type Cu+ transporter